MSWLTFRLFERTTSTLPRAGAIVTTGKDDECNLELAEYIKGQQLMQLTYPYIADLAVPAA